MSKRLLDVKGLTVQFDSPVGPIEVVSDVHFHVNRGETVGLVGESGCGKSVSSLAIMGLIPSPPAKKIGGEIWFQDKNLLAESRDHLRSIRGNKISMIFQDPMSSLDPAFTVGSQIDEAMQFHQKVQSNEAKDRSIELLRLVGISNPELRYHEYPHQLSGGMRQRVMIAMALACNPQLIIADEPTTALDVTVQAQILDLLNDLRQSFETAIIMITHDLGVVAETCDRVLVMYAGQIVEEAPTEVLFDRTAHPYTEGLLKSIPKVSGAKVKLYSIPGSVPNQSDMPKGCRFHPRCSYATSRCQEQDPPIEELTPGHRVKCWHSDQILRRNRGGV
ncbi:ABC transporter ATP-binding protein [Brevibacillus choshinensis]|uniref:ABC transporter ATP-binding protein n=1 Tax=Brevibacillus choshinensis TaxID=54911 RepID=A0ABX7FHN0_BRECH|nr:ABC transporter ATP-binding protein [Brevibacillus choshinensis]QRG65202.1 ABC transporter ATP-binding protein [Brevibacillus choshinensis]